MGLWQIARTVQCYGSVAYRTYRSVLWVCGRSHIPFSVMGLWQISHIVQCYGSVADRTYRSVFWSHDSSVSIGARLWAGWSRNYGSISSKANRCSSFHGIQPGSEAHPPYCLMAANGKMTVAWRWPFSLHLVPKLIIHGVIPPLPPLASMAWCVIKNKDKFTLAVFSFNRTEISTRHLLLFIPSSVLYPSQTDYG
jgi:hypothetical protein